MARKRWIGLILLLLVGGTSGFGYRAVHQSALNSDLIAASAAGDPSAVRALLDQGADPNTSEEKNRIKGWRRLLLLLLHRTQNGGRICPLGQALAAGKRDDNHLEVIRLLLAHHANPNAKLSSGLPIPLLAVEVELAQPDPADVRLLSLFLQYGANPNTLDSHHVSMLMYVASTRHASILRTLLDHGANPNTENANGDTPVIWAAYRGDTKSLRLLLSRGAEVNHKSKKGVTALHYAVVSTRRQQRKETVRILMDAGADVNAQNQDGCSPFLFALISSSITKQIHDVDFPLMLAHGADVRTALPPSAKTQTLPIMIQTGNSSMSSFTAFSAPPGSTPLMLAVQSYDVDLVRSILAKGVDVNIRDGFGRTASDYAISDTQDYSEIRGLLHQAKTRR